MIGKLTGKVDSFYDGFLILDVSGVGYRVFCSSKTAGKMPAVGGMTSLWIETQVREDHIHLIGFADATEQQAFNLLSTVQGVGAKVALAILSALSPHEIQMAVMTADVGALGSNETMVTSDGKSTMPLQNTAMEEAISALANLGYARIEAGMVVANVLHQNPEADTSELIRLSLKEIGKGNL